MNTATMFTFGVRTVSGYVPICRSKRTLPVFASNGALRVIADGEGEHIESDVLPRHVAAQIAREWQVPGGVADGMLVYLSAAPRPTHKGTPSEERIIRRLLRSRRRTEGYR
jgi:hypothetical protein